MSTQQTTRTSPPIPDLLDSDEHEQLRSSLRDMLAAHCTTEGLLAGIDADRTTDTALWDRVTTGLGLAGLLVPEEFGGDGASAREATVVAEELGRACAPVPYLSSAVLATVALVESARSGSETAAGLLPGLAEGTITAALVVDSTRGPREAFPDTVTAGGGTTGDDEARGGASGDPVVTGTVRAVLGADAAEQLVVPVLVGGEAALALVAASSATVSVGTSMDATRPVATVEFASAPAMLLARGDAAVAALATALRTGTVLLAAEQVGIAEWALETACGYLTVRHQFGRPIGSYQSLRHGAARTWIDVGQARATVRYAAAVLAEHADGEGTGGDTSAAGAGGAGGDEPAVAAALAKAHCSRIALEAAEDCLQIHGGIGFTWEHPLHLRLKRAFAARITLGDPERHRHDLGALLDIPAPDAPPAPAGGPAP